MFVHTDEKQSAQNARRFSIPTLLWKDALIALVLEESEASSKDSIIQRFDASPNLKNETLSDTLNSHMLYDPIT